MTPRLCHGQEKGETQPHQRFMPDQRAMGTEPAVQPKFRNLGEQNGAENRRSSASGRASIKSGCGRFAGLFRDFALQLARLQRQLFVAGLGEPVI